jgi:hypothetical protein
MPDKIKKTQNNKKQDGRFNKVNIKHDPQAESVRATSRRDKEESIE